MDEAEQLRSTIRKLVKGTMYLFIGLTIGILFEGVFSWTRLIINGCIYAFTVFLIFVNNKMNKRIKLDKQELCKHKDLYTISTLISFDRGKQRCLSCGKVFAKGSEVNR